MRSARRPLRCAALMLLGALLALPSFAADKARIHVDDYQIDAEIVPRWHRLIGKARIKFTALEDISLVSFELHNGLRPTKVVDESGHALSAERVTQDSSVRVALPSGLSKGSSMTLTLDYDGTLQSVDDSPVQGLKLASIGEDEAYLLYAGRWFPMVGYGTNRFTATINLTVPANWVVIGSGRESTGAGVAMAAAAEPPQRAESSNEPPPLKRSPGAVTPPRAATRPTPKAAKPETASAPRATDKNLKTYSFVWDQPSFPGTIVAGVFQESTSNEGGITLKAYYKPEKREYVGNYIETAVKEFSFFTTLWGPPLSTKLTLVQLPDDTLAAAWAPEIVALASRSLVGKINYRLLANTIAHQWWGADISPATRSDWWISDGFARYGEARYVGNVAGAAAYEEVTKDMEVGALAYDTVPLSNIGRMDPFSPEFQSLVTDKGAIILNMLHWVMGDRAFDKTMRGFATQFRGKAASVDDFRGVAEQAHGDKLTWFFSQWLDSTGAPEFKTKYTVYRLGKSCNDPAKCKGFRIVGEISQDLDLFRMPVDIRVDTDGKSEEAKIDVVGTNSAFTVETFGRPRRIVVDPENRVLRNASDVKIRAAILRGQGLVQQNDLAGALDQFQRALDLNKNSSLAHYRVAEVFFLQHNYQAAANAYRDALNGDGEPRWTEVWSHIRLGNIFDITGQRERATNEYRQAIQTNDDTQGALEEARKYLQQPFAGDKAKNS
ncbi:MAG TPA: M1 family aminopeptidase [Terriglobales bacterium]|nr:M1 family aminopeptidase [Terriglobales bacterium]